MRMASGGRREAGGVRREASGEARISSGVAPPPKDPHPPAPFHEKATLSQALPGGAAELPLFESVREGA
jgi:hypothetical protein